MDSTEREHEILPDTALHELPVDDDFDQPAGPAWVTPVLLFTALLLALVFSRLGVRFFFLPIILPFGLGGGRVLRRLLPAGRRVLRFQEGRLWLAEEGAWKTSTLGLVDVSSGAFLTLASGGVFVDGLEEAALRVVTSHGALTVPLRGGQRARTLRQELAELFEQVGVGLLHDGESLQGEVHVEPYDTGEEITWSLPLRPAGLFGSRTETALRVTADAWALRVRSGQRVLVSTGGPGALEAHVVPAGSAVPLGVVQDAKVLALVAEGEDVGRIGAELSEPELAFVVERIELATRFRH